MSIILLANITIHPLFMKGVLTKNKSRDLSSLYSVFKAFQANRMAARLTQPVLL